MDEYIPLEGRLTPQEIYRAASSPSKLPENFAISMRAYVIFLERGHETYDKEVDNYFSPNWGTALRMAIGLAEGWIVRGDGISLYYGDTLIRNIAYELCRDSVPRSERLL